MRSLPEILKENNRAIAKTQRAAKRSKRSPTALPLLLTVRELDGKSQVWFELPGGGELPIGHGDIVTIVARVHEIKRSGGYERGNIREPVTIDAPSEEAVRRREAFSLDIAEVFLLNPHRGGR